MIVLRATALALTTVLFLAVLVPAQAGSNGYVRDEFSSVSYSGNDGSVSWGGSWLEVPLTNGPTTGEFQVVSNSRCAASNCLRIGPGDVAGRGAFRDVDLTGSTAATLTFSFRRQYDGDGNGTMMVRASTDGWSWNTLRTYQLNTSDSGNVAQSIDVSAYAGSSLKLGFFGNGEFGGYFYVDNVQVALSSNASPTITTSLPDRNDTEADSVSFRVAATDPNDDDLSFSASGLPPGISINTNTGSVSGTLGYTTAAASPYTTVVKVADGEGGEDTESFIWSIDDLNRSPTMSAIANATAEEEVALQIVVDADDPDLPGDSLNYSLTSSPSGATINSSGVIKWTPTESNGPGTYGFKVKVKDSASPPASVVRSFNVTVVEVNAPPEVAYIPDQALGAGDTMSYPVVAIDADIPPNALTFAATGMPPGVAINRTSGLISGTIPTGASQGTGTATMTVRDNGTPQAKTVKTFAWQVTRGNHAPVLGQIADQNPESGDPVTFTATATDADSADTLNYWLADGIDPVPTGAAIDPDTGRFTWKPTEDQHAATYRINVGVSDSGSPRLSDTQLVTIVVPKINAAPEVTSLADQRSAEGDSVSLKVAASDPDDTDSLQFSASGLPGGLSINPSSGVISGAVDYEAAAASPYTVTVTATDNGKPVKSNKVSFQWRVDDTNRPPTATDFEFIAFVDQETPLILIAEDPDGDELEYTILDEPVFGVLEGEGPDRVYLTEGGDDGDTFTFMVSDGEFEAEAIVTIEIRTENNPPTASPDEYELDEGEILTVDTPGVLRNDSDPDNEELSVSVVSDPDHGVLVLNSDGSFTYQPDEGFVGGDKFIYVATDALGEESTATVVLTVIAAETVVVPGIDDSPRVEVVVATSALWEPPAEDDEGFAAAIPRAVVAASGSGISSLSGLGLPLLLLAIALLLALTVGRISYLPAAAAKHHERGIVKSFDTIHGLGMLAPTEGDGEVFVHGQALDEMETLTEGQEVEYVAADLRGRRIALRIWPAT
ncbi:MAG: tandem-95 repeat protein [bacterium]|nr:tandem-95 repeat protein [bacterium]